VFRVRRRSHGPDVVGFARQYADQGENGAPSLATDRVFGIPSVKIMLDARSVEFAVLREQMEAEWIPGLMEAVGLSHSQLPLPWDADFLFGPTTLDGRDT